jgi:lysophospholipase L1-like esterase
MLAPIIKSHYPLDLIIIMLGSNDMKTIFNMSPYNITSGAASLVKLAQKITSIKDKNHVPTPVLLVSPI